MLEKKLNDGEKSQGIYRDQLFTVGDPETFRLSLLGDMKLLLEGSAPMQTKQCLKSSEVRKMLSISSGRLQNLRVDGTLRYTKIGGMMFYTSWKDAEVKRLFERWVLVG